LGHFPRAISFCPFRANAGIPQGFLNPRATNNGQFDKLTDRTEGTLVTEPAEGALPKPYIYTVAHASGSECSVLFP